MKSIFEEKNHQEILNRMDTLNIECKAVWGRMTVSQMLYHCQKPLEIALERTTVKKPNFLLKMLYKSFKSSLYNDVPWKQNLPTAKEFIVKEAKDFETEKKQLSVLLSEFIEKRKTGNFPIHPIFGKFTTEQWGQAQYKHLDHHLKQFGN